MLYKHGLVAYRAIIDPLECDSRFGSMPRVKRNSVAKISLAILLLSRGYGRCYLTVISAALELSNLKKAGRFRASARPVCCRFAAEAANGSRDEGGRKAIQACKSPANAGLALPRPSPPQALDVAVADRGDPAGGEPFADRAAREQRVFADPPAGMRRRDRLDLAGHRGMQREMRDPRHQPVDRLPIALPHLAGLDRQGAAEMVDDRQPGGVEPRHRFAVAGPLRRPACRP